MKKITLLLLALLVVSFAISCGGGGEEQAEKMDTMGKEEMTAPTGYQAMAVTDGGTITGMVTYDGAMPEKTKIEVTKDVSVCGKTTHYKEDVVVGENKGLANVVVKITNINKGKGMDTMTGPFELDQHSCMFQPHVTLLPVGAELAILNSDGILHNIHTYSEDNNPINVAQPGFKKRMVQTFEKPEIIRIACDVHNWMGGYIVVAGHPYYAKTDGSGNFKLIDVPAGTYTLEYWHETLGKQTKEVTVTAGGSVEANAKFAMGS